MAVKTMVIFESILWLSGSGVVGKFRPVPPERTETSLTLLVNLKEHVLLVELLGLFSDG